MLGTLKRHEVEILLKAGHPKTEVARVAGVSLCSVKRIAEETPVVHVDDAAEREKRRIGRPSIVEHFREIIVKILEEKSDLPSLDILRRVREAGYQGGKTALYGLVASVRPKETKPLIRVDALRAGAQPEERSMWILSLAHLAEEADPIGLCVLTMLRKMGYSIPTYYRFGCNVSLHLISANKVRKLIALWASTLFSKTQLADRLRISRGTAHKYIAAFEGSALTSDELERLSNAELLVALLRRSPQTEPTRSGRYNALAGQLERIHSRMQAEPLSLIDVWREYAAAAPTPYKYSQFANRYSLWCKERHLTKAAPSSRLSIEVSPNDLATLRKWKLSNNRQLWERAVAILAMSNGDNLASISRKIGRSPRTIKKWCLIYTAEGFDRLAQPRTKAQSMKSLDGLKAKKDRLIKLIHESPRLHDINRASWSLNTLATVYERLHGASISKSSISEYFRAAGYKFKKAKKVLTSNDPEYPTKVGVITQILSDLKEDEAFFSIDEYGPFAIKRKGGLKRVGPGEDYVVPQYQKSKGWLILTAALELSRNQITHFYSLKKNTEEMIKMADLSRTKYRTCRTIYLSWDAASWHISKKLFSHLDVVNQQAIQDDFPIVKPAPLPAGAQFLNVIESVFSGMAKGIIHNSDYPSAESAKDAIDQYFKERNEFFVRCPKRAGHKIWGHERVPSEFSEANNCKDPLYR
jgi:transposase